MGFYYDDPRFQQYFEKLNLKYQEIVKELYQKPFDCNQNKISVNHNNDISLISKEEIDGQ